MIPFPKIQVGCLVRPKSLEKGFYLENNLNLDFKTLWVKINTNFVKKNSQTDREILNSLSVSCFSSQETCSTAYIGEVVCFLVYRNGTCFIVTEFDKENYYILSVGVRFYRGYDLLAAKPLGNPVSPGLWFYPVSDLLEVKKIIEFEELILGMVVKIKNTEYLVTSIKQNSKFNNLKSSWTERICFCTLFGQAKVIKLYPNRKFTSY